MDSARSPVMRADGRCACGRTDKPINGVHYNNESKLSIGKPNRSALSQAIAGSALLRLRTGH